MNRTKELVESTIDLLDENSIASLFGEGEIKINNDILPNIVGKLLSLIGKDKENQTSSGAPKKKFSGQTQPRFSNGDSSMFSADNRRVGTPSPKKKKEPFNRITNPQNQTIPKLSFGDS